MTLEIFSFSYMDIAKSDHFSPKIKPGIHEIGNQMRNHKIETKSELINEDGSICLTLIFIKFIGSDTL